MMESTLRRMTKSKDDIIEDAVTQLLMQLKRADQELHPNTNSNESTFQGIMKEVETLKKVLMELVNWEGELVNSFSMIERNIHNWLENKTGEEIVELSHFPKKIAELKEKVKIISKESERKVRSKRVTRIMSTYKMNQEDDVMSFIDTMKELDPHLRACLFSLSDFPEDAVLKRRLLIYWWIGLGLLPLGNGRNTEQLGEIFFADLINKRVLLPYIVKKHNHVVDQCTVQPVIHRNLNKKAVSTPVQVCTIQTSGTSVRAILNADKTHLKSDDICGSDKTDTHVAQIGQWHCTENYHIEIDKTDFVKNLGPVLTYLSLRGISRITELPECIGTLENLVILDLRACHNLERLPKKIKSLKKLTHLDIWECCLLDHMPEWIVELSSLEVLKGFVIGSLRSKDQCRFRDLSKKLEKLRKLSIKIIREYKITKEELHGLEDMPNLSVLTIMWGIHEKKHETRTLDFSLPKNLEMLDLRCFPRTQAPELLTAEVLKKLKRLYIRGGELAEKEILDSNNQSSGSELQILRLRFLNNFKTDSFKTDSFNPHAIFPNLRYMEYDIDIGKDGESLIWVEEELLWRRR